MSHLSQPATVMDKVKTRIGELEQAIQRLDFVKRHLNQNSTEIKSQIHSSISRHLETLRNREVRLLEEVDTVVGSKEDVLHRQQARLNKALGILHSSLAHASSTSVEDETASKHLKQALEQLNTTDLKAEETPYVAFRSDHMNLRESILNYGRVDAKGMPLLTAFADNDKPSASLPRHLEEYEDTEHHIFYKTLQLQGSNICVTMPKLSSRVEDWLQRPVLQFSASAEPPVTPGSETAGTPVSQTKCAIQNWLSQIKHNPDVEEEDDFEIVDHSGSSQRESPVEEEKHFLGSGEQKFVDMFQHIPRDIHLWLLKGSAALSGTAAEELRAFFKHIPQDTSMWLMTARQQLQSLEELKHGSWFRHISTEMSSWLRRAHDKRASTTTSVAPVPDFFAHISRDKNLWLKKESVALSKYQEKKSEEKKIAKIRSTPADLDKYLMKRPNQTVSAASVYNPIEAYLATVPSDIEYWLLWKEGNIGSASSGAPGTVNTGEGDISNLLGPLSSLNNSISAWLLKPAAEREQLADPKQNSSSLPACGFSHISNITSDWLLTSDQKSCSSKVKQDVLLNVSDDQMVWLSCTSAKAWELYKGRTVSDIPASPLDKVLLSYSQMTLSDWLLGGVMEKGIRNCDSPLSWAICSTESSLSSDCTDSSLGSIPSPLPISGHQVPQADLTAWIYQKCL